MIVIGVLAALLLCADQVDARTRTPLPTHTPATLPDLVVESARITIPGFTGTCLNGGSTALRLQVCIANRGTTAGPFNMTVNGRHFARVDGIDAMDAVCIFGPHTHPDASTIFLDDEDEIEESNENNNVSMHAVPIPTRPLDCTPTPTPTPLVTPSPPTPACPGDCNGDGVVAVHELITMVNIALDRAPLSQCPRYDDWQCLVCINIIVEAVGYALRGC